MNKINFEINVICENDIFSIKTLVLLKLDLLNKKFVSHIILDEVDAEAEEVLNELNLLTSNAEEYGVKSDDYGISILYFFFFINQICVLIFFPFSL